MNQIRESFQTFLQRTYPRLTTEVTSPLISENLLSEAIIELPTSVLRQAQDFVAAAYALRERPEYQGSHQAELLKRGLAEPGNAAFAMSYDFHVDPEGLIKLIEINTNASFLLMSALLYQCRGLPFPVSDFQLSEIQKVLLEEIRLAGLTTTSPRVLIIDEEPSAQRLFIEFLVYQELFRSWGWSTEIADTRSALPAADLIYNRDTDFYIEKPEHQALKQRWLTREFCLSPQPTEYLYLADKERMLQWNLPGYLENQGLAESQIATLRRHLPFATELVKTNAVELWTRRKSLFLKPKRSYGAKQSYRGSSISHRTFEDLVDQEILAQEFVPAPEVEVTTPDGPLKLKCDLRFYAYQGRVQSVVARLYQGQVTNLRTPHGGFACVRFV